MRESFICLWFLVAVAFTGYGLLWLLDRRVLSDHWERLAGGFPSGLAAAGAILYTFNVMGIPFARPLVLGVLGCGFILGMVALHSDQAAWMVSLKRHSERRFRPGLAGTICLVAAACVILGLLARALSEVNHLQDTELYHYPYAAIVFRTHHQPLFASQSMSEEFSFPPALFVCYAALWTCLGHINQLLPNVLPLPIFLSWTLLAVLAARRLFHCSDGAAAFALLLLAATYELEVLAGGESADLLPFALAGMALYWLARDLEAGTHRRTLLAAWLLGLNCWDKYHGIPFAGCTAAALFFADFSQSNRLMAPSHHAGRSFALPAVSPQLQGKSPLMGRLLSALRAPALLFAGAILVLIPFLIRNFITFGSPIYPGSLGPFHGVYSSEWSVRVVGAYWQPKLFYHLPDLLGRTLREPAVLIGVPALALAYRRQNRPAMFLGGASLLYLLIFLAAMNSDFPSALRFAGPSLGSLAWLGGWLTVEIEGEEPRTKVIVLGCFWVMIGAAVLLAPFVQLLWAGAGWSAGIVNYGWILLFVAGLTLLLCLTPNASTAGMPGYWTALAVGAVALLHHQPFPDFRDITGNIRKVDWTTAAPPSDVVGWMQKNLGPETVTYTYYAGRWPMPGALFPGDDPLTEPIHQARIAMPAVIETLRKLGIQYVFDWRGNPLEDYGAYRSDPVIAHIKDTRYFRELRRDNISALYEVVYPAGERPLQPAPSKPMPWLMDFAASGPQPRRSVK